MPIDVEQAMGAQMTQETQQWERDEVILYHLALGAGVPPTSPRELEYTYEQNLRVLPAYGATLGHILGSKYLDVPGLDFGPGDFLHGGHDLELLGPIPVAGRATTTSHVTSIHDKGSAALVGTEAVTRDDSGRTLFINRASAFIRGAGGFGGPPAPKAGNHPPERKPDAIVESPTLPQQALIYRLLGGRGAIHYDPATAKEAGFERPVLHGLCTFGMVCKAVVDHMLEGKMEKVARYQVRFAGVVLPGDTLVTEMWSEPGRILVRAGVKERGTMAVTNGAVTLTN